MTAPDLHDDRDRASREVDWLRENADALESSNRYVELHGLPLQAYWLQSVQREPGDPTGDGFPSYTERLRIMGSQG